MTSVVDGVERADDAEPDRYVESDVAAETAAETAIDATADAAPREWADLPASVRARIIDWAADVVGGAARRELPPTLQKVARFAPAKRARLAGAALAEAVQQHDAFRVMVAEHAAGLDADGPISADPSSAAARAVLLRSPDVDDLLAAAAAAQHQIDAHARIGELEHELRSVSARLTHAEKELARRAANPPTDQGAESERLKKRLRDQGTRLRALQDLLAAERAQAAAEQAELAAELDRARADVLAWRQRAETAAGRADAASATMRRLRDASDDRRAVDDRRLDLLLGVLESASAGLRREWNLITGGPTPADMVAERLPEPVTDRRTADPARLTLWAGLPGAHLVVDGYNVSKTGFPELVLADQRERLVRQLAAFAARTSAEVTVVFDGAAVATTRPFARGVRVLFSPPGVQADDVIADLVRVEPAGRVVIVVSTDRRVADHAVGAGARSAPSTALLAAMGG